MKYSDLYSIENQYFTNGRYYVVGRLYPEDLLHTFRLYANTRQPQCGWKIKKLPEKETDTLLQNINTGRYYLQQIRHILQP